MHRRKLLRMTANAAAVAMAGGATGAAAGGRSTVGTAEASESAPWAVVVADEREMRRVVDPGAMWQRVHSGGRWCEGPVWSAGRAALIFSDVRANVILSLAPGREAAPLRAPSNFANGNAVDAAGRIVSCEHLGRQLVRQEADGRLTVLADRFNGRRLNSPNDLAIAADGAIWFTDPTFGLTMAEEGLMTAPEQAGRNVYRLDPGGRLELVADGFEQPNGIVLSPDERVLYVSDTSGGNGHEGRHEIRAFDVDAGRTLRRERVFATVAAGVPDGLDVDAAGRVYAACADGVRVWRADGTPLGRIATASTCANLAFGGAEGRTLFACTGSTVQAMALNVAGGHRSA